MGVGAGELIVILVVVLIVFGAGRLGDLGSALPRAVKSFQSGASGEDGSEPPAEGSAPVTAVKKRRSHRFRPIGLILMGVGLMIYYADVQFLQMGLTLQLAAGAFVILGALVFALF